MDEQGVIEKLRKIELFDAVKDDEERLTKLAREKLNYLTLSKMMRRD
jgi:hypothetical protein